MSQPAPTTPEATAPTAPTAPTTAPHPPLVLPDVVVGPATKGLRLDAPARARDVLAARPTVTDDVFSWPLLTLEAAAVDHNVHAVARLCAAHGVEHAPHAKTSMSPQLAAEQLRAGAWGLTVAHAAQLRAVRAWGVQRVLLANELVDPREVAWLRRTLEASLAPGARPLEVWLEVDSTRGVALLAHGFAGASPAVLDRLGVLVELGVPGGRTGARGEADALDLARAVRAAGLRLLGVAAYEGTAAGGTTPDDLAAVAAFCRRVRDLGAALVRDGLVGPGPLVLSAGGSSFLDVVLAELPGPLPRASTGAHGEGAEDTDGEVPVRVVVRSGAYVTHDHGFCARMDPWRRIPGAEPLHPAATVWAQVLSVPEPGLAVCGVGRRDVPSDIDLPVALRLRALDDDGRLRPAQDLAGARVTALNDQHLFLAVDDDPGAPGTARLRPGDVVGLGVSHPCTLLDRWRVAAVVGPDDVVVDLVTTDF